MSNEDPKTVLIIGGGIGGLSAIAGLRKVNQEAKIILVEPKDHMEIYWASYRSPFEEWVADGSLILLAKFCDKNNVQHIRDVVTKVDHEAGKATLQKSDGKDISFDVCCVATGATTKWDGLGRGLPQKGYNGTKEERLQQMKATGDQLLEAGSILIVGGSLIGTELAGDIAGYAKKADKKVDVTVVHSGPYLCHLAMSESAGGMIQKKLEALGVKIHLNDKAVPGMDGTMTLEKSGEVLPQANKVIMAVGFFAINSLLSHIDGALNDKGFILTDEYFKVNGTQNVFAIGDCTTSLPNAGNQVIRSSNTIGMNLNAGLNNAPDTQQKFDVGFEAVVNTVGPDTGVFYCSYFYTQYLLPWVKNSTMFFMAPKDIGIEQ